MASNQDVLDRLEKFEDKYHLDMHGNSDLENGKRGLIENVRRVNEHNKKYPSLTYLLFHKTKTTIFTVIFMIALVSIVVQILTPEIVWSGLAGFMP